MLIGMRRPLAILVTGQPVPTLQEARGSYADIIRGAVGDAWPGPWLELDGRGPLPDCSEFAGLIITGSSANVPTREAWIIELELYLAAAVARGVSIFGICFGHQLLGQALGGLVTKNPKGREIGSVSVELLAADPLLGTAGGSLLVNTTHVDSIARLPPGARLLARSRLDAHSMVRFAECVWGVQFHPELDAHMLGHYLAARRSALAEEGLDASAIESALADTPASMAILRRFAGSVLLKC
jgi:GMP synthase (glutamine-hydrolysing)